MKFGMRSNYLGSTLMFFVMLHKVAANNDTGSTKSLFLSFYLLGFVAECNLPCSNT